MPIPDYQSLMLPLLRYAGDGQEHSLRETIDALAAKLNLTEEERGQLLPSGLQATFDNRVGWARSYLKKAALVESPRRGFFRITPRGREVLKSAPARIDVSYLKRFPEFVESMRPSEKLESVPSSADSAQNPEESIESAYSQLRHDLANEVLDQVKKRSPAFFERLVVDIIVGMGYGGTRKDAGQAVGKSGDGGIDGIIKEDRLGLDVIYVQAKRWDTAVSRPELQKFAGALLGNNAKKGIFITTSQFTQQARDYVEHLDSKIILIDGEMLAELMIDYGVGVNTSATYELKRVDSDYFEE